MLLRNFQSNRAYTAIIAAFLLPALMVLGFSSQVLCVEAQRTHIEWEHLQEACDSPELSQCSYSLESQESCVDYQILLPAYISKTSDYDRVEAPLFSLVHDLAFQLKLFTKVIRSGNPWKYFPAVSQILYALRSVILLH